MKLGKKLKKNSVALDIVNFGEEADNTSKLEALLNAVNSDDNSHLVTVPPGPHVLSDILLTSPIVQVPNAAVVAPLLLCSSPSLRSRPPVITRVPGDHYTRSRRRARTARRRRSPRAAAAAAAAAVTVSLSSGSTRASTRRCARSYISRRGRPIHPTQLSIPHLLPLPESIHQPPPPPSTWQFAWALRVSMEEERARQEAESKKADADAGTSAEGGGGGGGEGGGGGGEGGAAADATMAEVRGPNTGSCTVASR